jgi:hypothetical protein
MREQQFLNIQDGRERFIIEDKQKKNVNTRKLFFYRFTLDSPLLTRLARPLQRTRLTLRLATTAQTTEAEDSRARTRRIVVPRLKMTLRVRSTAATRAALEAVQPTTAAFFLRCQRENVQNVNEVS